MLSPFLLFSKKKSNEPPAKESPKKTGWNLPKRDYNKEVLVVPPDNSPVNTKPAATTMTSKTVNISTEDVKKLRDMTGVSVMQCKKALEEAGGDIEKAKVILHKKSGDIAAKKSDRTFKAGV